MSLLHLRARGPHPAYPERAAVTDARVPWTNSYPRYKPVEFIHRTVADNMTSTRPWADPKNVDKKVLSSRFTLVGSVKKPRKRSLRSAGFLNPRTQRPRNPVGRTGMRERGLLGKYGPNHAADPIVMRLKPDSPTLQLQFVAIRRRDTGEWAIPGGMVEAGQTIAKTLYDEFTQEALRAIEGNDAMTDALKAQIADFFAKQGITVYAGYVDDPRNTDDAWMETVATLFLVPPGHPLSSMPLAAGDDASAVAWMDVTDDLRLYASHERMVRAAEEMALARVKMLMRLRA